MCRHCRNLMFICISIVARCSCKKVATKLPLPVPRPSPSLPRSRATSKSCALAANELTMDRLFGSGERVVGQDKLPFPLYLHLFLLLFSRSFSSHTQSPTRLAICNVKHELAP